MKQRNFIFASLGHMVFFMSLSCFFTSCQIYYKACAGLSSVNKIHPGDCFSRGEMHMMNQEIFKSEYLKSKIHATMYPFYLSDIQSSCVGLYYYEGFSEENFRFPCPVIPVLRLEDTYKAWSGDSLADKRVVDTFLQTYEAYFSDEQGHAVARTFMKGRTYIKWEEYLLGE